MNILCVGDIVGRPGREVFTKAIAPLKAAHGIDVVIANAENASGGAGLVPRAAKELFAAGADVLTLGDHTWDKKEIYPYLQEQPNIIRPDNFPPGAPGRGWCIVEVATGVKVGVINLLGRTFMRYNVDCPFRAFDKALEEIRRQTPVIVVDIHAETTSEKNALGHYADGKVTVVFGTHTHIQTADEKILPKKTAYITDVGMTGPYDSVIGQQKERIIQRFLTSMPHKFEVALGDAVLHGILVDVDEITGQARRIVRIQHACQSEAKES